MTDSKEKRGFILDSSDDDGDQTGQNSAQESYRSEIEDIVKGFILEKDLMSQGHEEEVLRMRQNFNREKADLLRHLEDEREVLRQNSRITSITSNETGYISGSHDSEALHLNLYGGDLAGGSGAKRESAGLSSAHCNVVDNDLVKEIAEVYLRMNNGTITSRIRPDLDIEDKFEHEREIFERKFGAEKRELKRKMEEDYNYKLEQEKNRYEGQIQEFKSTITDLQWQKRELESRIRNEKEKCEINFERERNEIEKRHLKLVHEVKRKIEEKHSQHIVIQKDKYEENISELQTDITKLTTQLRELNENLRQEKDIIVNRLEKEIKEMEQTFADQRNSIKLSLEAEFSLKLENELSVLKTINRKLQGDLDMLEREKKPFERKQKEERRKLEEHYEEEISEMEKKYTEEKHSIKIKLEERYQHLITSEKTSLELTVSELREEVVLLRQENAQIDAAFKNRNDELRQQLDYERDECRNKLQDAKDDLKIRLENEFSQKIMNESCGHLELVQQLDRDLGMMKARYGEVEAAIVTLRQERDILARERDEMQRKLMNVEFEMDRRKPLPDSHMDNTEIDKFREIVRNKDQEIATTKVLKEQTEISMSGLRREKMDLEDEVAKLKRSFPAVKSQSEFESSPRPNLENIGLVSLQDSTRRNEEEVQHLKRGKIELDARISTLQRKNDELEDELSALRRKKLEVEDEISSVKRDKSDSDNQISVLRKEKIDLDEYILALKKKQMELQDNISALQRENMNKDHGTELLQRTIDTLKEEIQALRQKAADKGNETDRSIHSKESYTPRAKRPTSRQIPMDDYRGRQADNYKYMEEQITKQSGQNDYTEQSGFDDFNESLQSIEQDMDELIRQKKELEHSVRQLKDSKSQLERNIAKLQSQIESTSPAMDRFDSQVNERDLDDLETKKRNLENAVRRLEEKKGSLERDVAKFEQSHRSSSRSSTYSHSYERDLDDLETKKRELEIIVRQLEDNRTALERDIDKFENLIKPMERDFEELERKNHDLVNTVKRFEEDKEDLEKEISQLKYESETASLEAKQRDNLEDAMAKLKAECVDLENRISKLRREENGLEGHIEDLKINEQDLHKRIRILEIDEQRVNKDIARLQEEKNKLQNDVHQEYGEQGSTLYGNAQQGSGRRITGITQVSIERVRRHDNKDHELAELRKERDSLKKEIAVLKKNLDGKNINSYQHKKQTHQTHDTFSNERNISNDVTRQMEHNEVVALKKERLEIEKTVATLLRQKTEVNAEITVIMEVKKREDDELNSLRRERIELETIVTTLQSRKSRLETELSVMKDEKKKYDDQVDALRRQKHEVEKQFYDLQSKKTKMEAELSMAESALKKNDNALKDFYTDTASLEQDLKALRKERSDLEAEVKRLQAVRDREQHEHNVLRQQLEDLKKQIAELKNAEEITKRLSVQYEKINSREVSFTMGGAGSYDKLPNQQLQPPLSPGRVTTSIEIPHLSSPGRDGRPKRSFEADETMVIPHSQYGFLQAEKGLMARGTPSDGVLNRESSPTCHTQFSDKDNHLTRYPGQSQHPNIPFNNDNQPRQNQAHDRNIAFDVSYSTTTCGKCGGKINSQEPTRREEYPGTYQGRSGEDTHSVNGYDSQHHYSHTKDFNDTQRTQGSRQGPHDREEYPRAYQGRSGEDTRSVNGYDSQHHYSHTKDFNDTQRTQGSRQGPHDREEYPRAYQGRDGGGILSMNGYDPPQSYPKSNDSHSSPHRPGIPGGSHQWESSRDGTMKEDNDVKILRREKLELESQITELRVQLKKLQTDISELENLKTVKETLHGHNGGYQQNDLDFQTEMKKEWSHTRLEEKNDRLRQEYEEKLQELKVENTALKQKVGLLEWQVENTKQKMEIQEMSFRRELSAIQEKYSVTSSSTRSTKLEVNSDISKFKEFYQHLSYLVVRDISNEEILREIRTAIKDLDQQKVVNVDHKNSSPNTSHLKSYSYDEKPATTTLLDNDQGTLARQLKIQLEIADKQLKTSEKIIHRLYAENSELNNMVHKLESKLKTASRSTEKLQRKRVLLQKLVEKLSGQVGKDQLRQAYLVLELDKDISI